MTQRRRTIAKSEVRHQLVRRAIGYWCYCLLVIFTISVIWSAFTVPSDTSFQLFHNAWKSVGAAVVGALLVIPLMVRDLRWFSNRFVGPIEKMRASLKDLANGEQVAKIHFRKNDFWSDLADDFNTIAARQNRLQEDQPSPENQSPHEPVLEDATA